MASTKSVVFDGHSAAIHRPAAVSSAGPRLAGLFAGGLSVVGDAGNLSGIRKRPVAGLIGVGLDGLQGDEIFDRRFHGSPDQAICQFSAEYYAALQAHFAKADEPWQPGGFGENFSTTGLLDGQVCIGDIYRSGTVVWQVSQPRSPCWKLNARFGVVRLSRHVQDQRMTGWYARVLQPGQVEAGAPVELLERGAGGWSIVAFWDAVLTRQPDPAQLQALASLPALAREWQQKLAKRAAWLQQRQAGSAPAAPASGLAAHAADRGD